MKTSSQITIVLMAAVATQVQAASLKGRPKAFSISRNSDVSSDGTITYNSVDVDTTVGWIDASSGEFVTPDEGVYRFTFTANVLCPPKTDCTGEVSIVANDQVIAKSHEVNTNFDFGELSFFHFLIKLLSRIGTTTICFSYQNPTTINEPGRGTISLNVLAKLKASQHVKVEWKGTIGGYLKGDGKSIIFTGEKL